jgi:hypothetical protein
MQKFIAREKRNFSNGAIGGVEFRPHSKYYEFLGIKAA